MKGMLGLILLIGGWLPVAGQFTCVRGDCYNGRGACVFPSGARYEGAFEKGRLNGLGIMFFPNGDRYSGEWKDQERNGNGRFRFASGHEYLGAFSANQMQGKGTMTYASGNEYRGEWAANRPHGKGTFLYTTGQRYEGYFVDGVFEGPGKMFYPDGSRYEGQWKAGQKHGRGLQVYADGLIREGNWAEGAFVGSAADEAGEEWAVRDSGTPPVIRNCNLEYCDQEYGEYTYRNGTHYSGYFVDGLPQGEGKVRYATGDWYEGGWRNHAPHGEGTLHYLDGRTVSALWDAGKPLKVLDRQTVGKPDGNTEGLKVWALVVGVAEYRHMPSLRFTDDDAYQMYAFLKSPRGGALPDAQLRLLIDEDATRAGILQAMRELFLQAGANDAIVFYFSGHGVEGAFLPSDYDGYNNQLLHEEVKRMVEESPAKHKIVIADACHSGSIFLRRTPAHLVLQKFYSAFENTQGGLALLMSSKGEEFSLEDGGLRSGVFSYFFIRALQGTADRDGNGIVTVRETFDYVYRNVRLYTGNVQTPVLMGWFDQQMPLAVVH